MADPAYALPGGYVLHEYRIDALLGAGGFGLTYLATDANLNLKVALKEYLPNEFAARGEGNTVEPRSASTSESFNWGLQRFMDEARTLATFHHSAIVRVMRFFEANRTGYMVMEFVDGQSLSDWIEPRRPLPQVQLLAVARPLLDGLEVIHGAGYLHRDVKPANIYIRGDGSPVLLDFGSARQMASGGRELTAVVSPGYAPFEQYHTHGRQGPWTDLYAIGGVLYWMASGVRPVEAAARVKQDIMPPVAQVAPGGVYGNQLLAAIDWALKPGEEERPQNVAEFRRALEVAAVRPAGRDSTIPVGAAAAASGAVPAAAPAMPTGLTGVALDRAALAQVETELARLLGPIAAVVVRGAAKKATSIPALAQAVAAEIADAAQRAAFLGRFTTGEGATGTSGAPGQAAADRSISQKFSAAMLKQAETALAGHIGAIARVVVNRAAAKARDEAELYLLIADEIRDPVERKNFIRKAVSVSSRK